MHVSRLVTIARSAPWSGLGKRSPAILCVRPGRLSATSPTMAGMTTSPESSPLEVVRVPMFSDNYGWILRDKETNQTAAVDPAEPEAIARALQERSWKLDYILNTHHHHDHVGGNTSLKSSQGCVIVGPKADEGRIPGIDTALADGDTFRLGSVEFKVYDTPGHTRGHITFWAPAAEALFPGDTLFAMGCGRLFEGTPAQMWKSLSKLLHLPPQTAVYCAHEYTQSNARWAVAVDPGNSQLQKRAKQVFDMREQGVATVPSTFGEELATNPFLRPDAPGIRQTLGISPDASNEDAFGIIRRHKDSF